MKPSDIVIQQDNKSGGVTYAQGGAHHSVADRRGVSMAAYIHALYGFVRQTGAAKVLMIGCGGGTLATMLARAGVGVTMVDIDPVSFAIARRYFHLPASVACHVGDGAAFLRASTQRYDAIILDAYQDGHVPRHLVTARFFSVVKARLGRGGIFLINLIVADDEDHIPDRVGYRLQQIFSRVRLLDADGELDRNAIAAAGAVGKLRRPRLLLRPQKGAAELASALKQLDFRKLRV